MTGGGQPVGRGCQTGGATGLPGQPAAPGLGQQGPSRVSLQPLTNLFNNSWSCFLLGLGSALSAPFMSVPGSHGAWETGGGLLRLWGRGQLSQRTSGPCPTSTRPPSEPGASPLINLWEPTSPTSGVPGPWWGSAETRLRCCRVVMPAPSAIWAGCMLARRRVSRGSPVFISSSVMVGRLREGCVG